MDATIRRMNEGDRGCVIDMMRAFYASPAVRTSGSEAIFARNVDACVGDSPYAEGYLFEQNGDTVGYGMIARSYSTEFGVPCVWIEDIYIKPAYRGLRIGSAFIAYIQKNNQGALLKLEVERENKRALRVYQHAGMEESPYAVMVRYLPASET